MRRRETTAELDHGQGLLPKPMVETWGSDRPAEREWLIRLGVEPDSDAAGEMLRRSKRAYGLPVTALERAMARAEAERGA